MRARAEEIPGQRDARVDVRIGEDGRAGGHPAHQRQAGVVGGLGVEQLLGRAQQADAARGAGQQGDGALALQCPQVILGRGRRAEAEGGDDLRPCRRQPVLVAVTAQEVEDFGLAGGEVHGRGW